MNIKTSLLYIAFISLPLFGYTQDRLMTKNSTTTFYSHAPLEDIKAKNGQTSAAIDLKNGEVVVKMLIKHFEFENALMQEHFNENYMESEKYPSAIFKGAFGDGWAWPISLNETIEIPVKGTIKVHGIEKEIETMVTMTQKEGTLEGKTVFMLKPVDFNIEIPKLVIKNIAEEIEVTSILIFEM